MAVLGAPVLEALVLDAQVLAVAWPSGGGLEQPFRTASVENAGCTTPTPRRRCCLCARMAISLRPWFWSVAGDVDSNSAANGLFVDRPGEPTALRGCRGVGIDHRRGLPRANGINARGARCEPSETFEFRAVSLQGGPGEDMRTRARLSGLTHLSHTFGPGMDRSNRVCPFASARWGAFSPLSYPRRRVRTRAGRMGRLAGVTLRLMFCAEELLASDRSAHWGCQRLQPPVEYLGASLPFLPRSPPQMSAGRLASSLMKPQRCFSCFCLSCGDHVALNRCISI
jgi:hypothetical protein